MSEPITSSVPPKRASVLKCELHGLHYDSEKMSGCVICRREAGGTRAQEPIDLPRLGTSLRPLLVTTGLILGAGFLLNSFHEAAATYVRSFGSAGTLNLSTVKQREMMKIREAEAERRSRQFRDSLEPATPRAPRGRSIPPEQRSGGRRVPPGGR